MDGRSRGFNGVGKYMLDAIETIMSRTSVRKFREKPIDNTVLETILRAGTSGPSCVDARDWSSIVVRNRKKLIQMADANGSPAEPLKGAALGVLVCGDLERAFTQAKDYWVIDCSIAAQNMTLAAQALGIGSVWLGTWPQMERVERQRQIFALPEHIVPHSILAFGYPAMDANLTPKDSWEPNRVHYEEW